jgi:hypothetical protein
VGRVEGARRIIGGREADMVVGLWWVYELLMEVLGSCWCAIRIAGMMFGCLSLLRCVREVVNLGVC